MNHVLVAGRDISVRPEHVSLTELGSEAALHGTIREATFAGAFTRFDIALDDGTTIIAMQLNNADRTFTAGDTVGVRLL
jgi:ABC-type Fe3+/spermidine/putrescine transport system ATPase subunit